MSFTSDLETLHIEETKSNINDGSEIKATFEQKLIDHLFHNELQIFKQNLESQNPLLNILPIHDKKHYNCK